MGQPPLPISNGVKVYGTLTALNTVPVTVAQGGTGAATVSGVRTTFGIDAGTAFITSGTSWTSPSYITPQTLFKVTVIGAGGGGGGNAVNNDHSCGGGGGGVGVVWLTGLAPSTAYATVIGTAGIAGTNAPTAGGAGTLTSISINAVTYTANGGAGGPITPNTQTGGAGGTTVNCTVSITGQNGGGTASGTTGVPGNGGSSGLGFGLGGVGNVPFVGNDGTGATGYGGGGEGTTGAGFGGPGTQGAILIEWFN